MGEEILRAIEDAGKRTDQPLCSREKQLSLKAKVLKRPAAAKHWEEVDQSAEEGDQSAEEADPSAEEEADQSAKRNVASSKAEASDEDVEASKVESEEGKGLKRKINPDDGSKEEVAGIGGPHAELGATQKAKAKVKAKAKAGPEAPAQHILPQDDIDNDDVARNYRLEIYKKSCSVHTFAEVQPLKHL